MAVSCLVEVPPEEDTLPNLNGCPSCHRISSRDRHRACPDDRTINTSYGPRLTPERFSRNRLTLG